MVVIEWSLLTLVIVVLLIVGIIHPDLSTVISVREVELKEVLISLPLKSRGVYFGKVVRLVSLKQLPATEYIRMHKKGYTDDVCHGKSRFPFSHKPTQ